MAPTADKPAMAGTKRKFNMFAMDQELVDFLVDGKQFSVHEGLLQHIIPSWGSAFGPSERFPRVGNAWAIPDTSPWAFCGFMHWLYNQELPNETMLKEKECPHGFDIGTESEPLACSMAVDLYDIGQMLGVTSLRDAALAHVFREYQSANIVPDMDRTWQVFGFDGQKERTGNICELLVDVCLKRKELCRPLIQEAADIGADLLPRDFVFGLCVGHFKLDKPNADCNVTNNFQGPLKLSDYHWHSEDDSVCPCKRSARDEFLIK
ncbi:hypothetical protein P171DRAFT_446543 [Karstenula rhodostoma CBS 690.94]|uniref:BTB domain-containing protein n=1 Tax=Karstenula rhodostoma CBS 690.94 TaxID=1392251 RepID=A0A9P4PD71_9PLEO|nr:hypothetical protein P171DRAFT_446543 [Karstenula rhodostoma CBS 690.94]